MNFSKLTIRNFLSIAEAEMGFEVGVHLVHGVNYDMGAEGQESNGSGKSSLISDALLWCLFGILSRGKGKENDVINKAEGKNCCVTVEFTHNGRAYRISRFRKDDTDGDGLRWWLDGKEQSSHRSRDTKKDLALDLPVSATVFRHAVQVGQGMPDRFLDLSETAKQELLCEIVDLRMYDLAAEFTKGKLAEADNAVLLTDSLQRGILSQIENWEKEKATYEDALRAYQAQAAPDVEKVTAEVEVLDKMVEDLRIEAESSNETMQKIEDAKNHARRAHEAANADAKRLYGLYMGVKSRFEGLLAAQEKAANANAICPVCKRPMEVTNQIQHMMELAAEADRVKKDVAAAEGPYTEAEAKRVRLRADLDRFEIQVRDAGLRSAKVVGEMGNLTRKREGLKVSLFAHEKQIAQLKGKIEFTSGSIEKMRDSLAPSQEKLAQARKEVEHWKWWKTTIPNLRASAVEEVLSFLNERLAYYMDIFSAGAMAVRLYQEAYGSGSKIKVELKTPGGSYAMSSGGEKRRVDLAVYLSLSDLLQMSSGMKCNILVADEICDGLSPLGVKQFLEVLRQKAALGTAIYVITHNPAVNQSFEFDSIKVVERKGGRARLLQA